MVIRRYRLSYADSTDRALLYTMPDNDTLTILEDVADEHDTSMKLERITTTIEDGVTETVAECVHVYDGK